MMASSITERSSTERSSTERNSLGDWKEFDKESAGGSSLLIVEELGCLYNFVAR